MQTKLKKYNEKLKKTSAPKDFSAISGLHIGGWDIDKIA